MMPGVGLWLTEDIAGVLRGLGHTAASMPAGTFQAGYVAALEAVALAVGAVDAQEDRRRVVVSTVFDDLTHESVPFAAFARMEK